MKTAAFHQAGDAWLPDGGPIEHREIRAGWLWCAQLEKLGPEGQVSRHQRLRLNGTSREALFPARRQWAVETVERLAVAIDKVRQCPIETIDHAVSIRTFC